MADSEFKEIAEMAARMTEPEMVPKGTPPELPRYQVRCLTLELNDSESEDEQGSEKGE